MTQMKLKFPSLSRRADEVVRSPPRVPEGQRIYAIGDIHGRADLLRSLFDHMVDDLKRFPIDDTLCIFLGDYVDRGPDSQAVLELLTALASPTRFISLRGNHEMLLLSFLNNPSDADVWRANGGLETLHSYGVNISAFRSGRGLEKVAKQFRAALPSSHLDFLRQTRLSISVGDYFFCHAGVRPGTPLDTQRQEDVAWIRDEFLLSEAYHGKVVVHGHTSVLTPEVKHNRINIDTGAYISECLTALVLEGETQRFLSTRPGGAAMDDIDDRT